MNSINTNRMALNTANALSRHYSRVAASVGRLSSGLRVRSSGDDAAGLAIRELMRADIAATAQGIRNANDAISLVQVADGALGIIDEKLIRMKELAEQAATGTYNSDQRLLIDSEFKAMAAEIDRIAAATDFNGIRLLDGTLTGAHDGKGFAAAGSMKIHFGAANDSAEDYYYLSLADCTTKGLGLHDPLPPEEGELSAGSAPAVTLNDCTGTGNAVRMPESGIAAMQDLFQNGVWSFGLSSQGQPYSAFIFTISAGARNIVINTNGYALMPNSPQEKGHNDIQLFTAAGKHLAGTPRDDYTWHFSNNTSIAGNQDRLPFTEADYDGSALNTGPAVYSGDQTALAFSSYNGMRIGYTGDGDRHDAIPNDGTAQTWPDYQVLTIDEAKEDLIIMLPGDTSSYIKAYWDASDEEFIALTGQIAPDGRSAAISIKTQVEAQRALERIDGAIVAKDKVRAHLGAMQNRLENTVTHLSIQRENLQAAESQISDVDISAEMTNFVRSQIKAQAGIAMLSQANSLPRMALSLLNS